MEKNEDWGCCSDGTDTEDQETINLKDWNDEEYNHNNPFKPSPEFTPKLQFRKDVSKARWDEDMGMAEVTEKKGGMWTTTGIIRGGMLYCLLEETLDDPPSKAEIQLHEAECKGIPLKFCHLEHGRVSFFSFDKVELPFLP
eukprot:TRINITY_DN3010_c0_g1_i1.p1 TRINITY_DN3010_c0_g1~~TRINITY_DN3010_c0_g1_i1.p1  ORF type:complete len:141 (-),score=38.13 TRINITY_DN3010_c0_g1_i1:172-594(-)